MKEPKKTWQGKIIGKDGIERWYKDGKQHREDGPAVIDESGVEVWYKDGLRHRVDGPAVKNKFGTEWWYKDGKWHREDGPAYISKDWGKQYYLNNSKIKEKDYLKVLNCPLEELPLYINTELAPIAIRRLESYK